MAQTKRKHKRNHHTKLFPWRWRRRDLDQGAIESFFNTLFLTNKSEKKKIINLFAKQNIQSLLFYTDMRNLPNILAHGIVPLKQLKLKPHGIYRVWSFDQEEETISLEFDLSSRGNFWKWFSDLQINPNQIATIGINPKRLSELTQKDWLIDWAKNMIIISEPIYLETFDWILVQDVYVYKAVRDYLLKHNYPIDLYYGHKGLVKIQRPSPKIDGEETKSLSDIDIPPLPK